MRLHRFVNALFIGVPFGFVVASGQPAEALPCNNGVCKLDVTVTGGSCASPANITVAPDPLPVPKGSPNKIEWTIQTNGYTWAPAPNGITSLPSPMFTNPHNTGNGKKYDIQDANTNPTPTDYKYDIRLMGPDGTRCAVKDPTIKNGN
jgi:hypothetical protein